MKALLFINGVAPQKIPHTESYQCIACTDGAVHSLEKIGFPMELLDFISGDMDSYADHELQQYKHKMIYTPDQNKTDFHKALEILIQRGVQSVEVYGGSGGEMDHFLGNITVAFRFKDVLDLKFYDEHATYFFVPNRFTQSGVSGRMISLYPFPIATNVVTQGLQWPLYGEELSQTDRIGTRNIATEDTITISYDSGAVLLFLGN